MGNNASSHEDGGQSRTKNKNNRGGHNNGIHSTPSHQSHAPPLRNFLTSSNLLGLSKAELDARCQPSGLYPSCPWDDKAIRRLIGDGKLAARQLGTERRENVTDVECPICFLHYSVINKTKCCHAYVCTECYLQVRPQKLPTLKNGKTAPGSPCPFCNATNLRVEPAVTLSMEEINQRIQEEIMIREAQNRMRGQYMNEDQLSRIPQAIPSIEEDIPMQSPLPINPLSANLPPHKSSQLPPSHVLPGDVSLYQQHRHQASVQSSPVFGALDEQDPRSGPSRYHDRNLINDESSNRTQYPQHDMKYPMHQSHNIIYERPRTPEIQISEMAMSPADRYALEQEMRRQGKHPLSIRLQAEEAERRLRNDLRRMELQRESGPGGLRDYRESRDWNQRNTPARNNNNEVTSFDEMVVLEAAIMLSMQEEEARQRAEVEKKQHLQRQQQAATDYPAYLENKESVGMPLVVEDTIASQRSVGAWSEEEQYRMAIQASLNQGKQHVSNKNEVGQLATFSTASSVEYEQKEIQFKVVRDQRYQNSSDAVPSGPLVAAEFTPSLHVDEKPALGDSRSYSHDVNKSRPLIGNSVKPLYQSSPVRSAGKQSPPGIVEISLPQKPPASHKRSQSSEDFRQVAPIGYSSDVNRLSPVSHPPTSGHTKDDETTRSAGRRPATKPQERPPLEYPESFIRMYPDYEDAINASQSVDTFHVQHLKRAPSETETYDPDMDSKPAARVNMLKSSAQPSRQVMPKPGILISEFAGRRKSLSGSLDYDEIEEEKCALVDDVLFDDSTHV